MAAGLDKWKKEAILTQDLYSSKLNDRLYDRFQACEENEFRHKILGILFGPIPTSSDVKDVSMYNWESKFYKKDQIEKCRDIIARLKEHSVRKDCYDIAYINVCVYYYPERSSWVAPLFRVRSTCSEKTGDISKNIFVDHLGRVYKSWCNYIDENTWERSYICIPVDGYYSTFYNYLFVDQTQRGKVMNAVNKVSSFMGIASAVSAVAGVAMTLFPPTAPLGATVLTSSLFTGVPSGVIGITSGINKLCDRSDHQQSIGLDDAESRMCWLNISVGAASFAAAGLSKGIAVAAGAGKAISQSIKVVGNTLTITSLGLCGTGVAVNEFDLPKKRWSNVTALDFLQLSTSILLFTNSAVNITLVNSVINEAQNNQINNMKSPLGKKDQIKIDRLVEQSVAEHGSVVGKQKMILDLKKVNNVPAFLSKWRKVAGELKPAGRVISPSDITVVPQQRSQLASSNNVVIGTKPVAQLSNSSSECLNMMLFKLSEFATEAFLHFVAKYEVNSLVHMNSLIERFVKYLINKISDMRARNPNPKINPESTPNVRAFYEQKAIQEISKTEEIMLFSTEETASGFIPELNPLPIEKYSEFVDEMVNGCANDKKWIQKDNSLSCICTLKSREVHTIMFYLDDSKVKINAVNQRNGKSRVFPIPEIDSELVQHYSELVEEMVDRKENVKKWLQNGNYLSCICTLASGEVHKLMFFETDSVQNVIVVDEYNGRSRCFDLQTTNEIQPAVQNIF